MLLSAGVPFLSVPSEELTFESTKEIAVHCCFTIFLSGIIMAKDMIWANEGICHTLCVIIHSKWNQVMSGVELDWDSSKACMHGLHEHDYPSVTKFSMVILHSYNACKHCPAIATWLICSFKYISVTSGGSFLEVWLFSLSQLTVFSFPNVPGYLLSKLRECEAEWILVVSAYMQKLPLINTYLICHATIVHIHII